MRKPLIISLLIAMIMAFSSESYAQTNPSEMRTSRTKAAQERRMTKSERLKKLKAPVVAMPKGGGKTY